MSDPAEYFVRNLRNQPVEVHTGHRVLVLPPRGTADLAAPERGAPQLAVLERHRHVAVRARDPRVNVNAASAAQLTVLPGISDATAAAIVAHRERRGRFARLDDLDEVPGIGPATLRNLEGHVTFRA